MPAAVISERGGEMREHSQVVSVNARPEDVWEFLSDYSNLVTLCTGTAKCQMECGEPRTPGATYHATVEWEGIPSSYPVMLKRVDPPRSLTWASNGSGAKGSVTFELEPDGSGTRVKMSYSLDMASPLQPLEPFGWGLLTRLADRFARKLRAVQV